MDFENFGISCLLRFFDTNRQCLAVSRLSDPKFLKLFFSRGLMVEIRQCYRTGCFIATKCLVNPLSAVCCIYYSCASLYSFTGCWSWLFATVHSPSIFLIFGPIQNQMRGYHNTRHNFTVCYMITWPQKWFKNAKSSIGWQIALIVTEPLSESTIKLCFFGS